MRIDITFTQLTFTYSMSTMETLEKYVKYGVKYGVKYVHS